MPSSHACALRALATTLLVAAAGPAVAMDAHRPDAHAPIGVMGDHTHHAGEWMLSYRYMWMDMDGNRDGTSRESTADVLADYPVAPKKMKSIMDMLGVMYAPSDRLTLMAMVPWVRKSMDHQTAATEFTTTASALGDSKLGALWVLRQSEHEQVHLNLGLGLPTGDTDRKDTTPAGRVRLPYPMQTGSGSWELLPGITWLCQGERISLGAQALGTFRIDENSRGYQLGPQLDLNAWASRVLSHQASASLRLRYSVWSNIHGADDQLDPAMVPTADPDRRAGRRLDAGLGLNWEFERGALHGHRLAAEFLVPVYQWLDGPQLETQWTFVVGWQKAF